MGSPQTSLPENLSAEVEPACIVNAALKDDDPVGWLVERQPGEHWFFWGAFWLVVVPWIVNALFLLLGAPGLASGATLALQFGCGLGASGLMAFAASRFFLQKRRDGEVELLLSSPVGTDIVRGQWRATRRTLDPAVGMLGMVCLGFFLLIAFRSSLSALLGLSLIGLGLAMVSDVLRLVAACWVGMWFGLRVRENSSAVVWTTLLVSGIPWLAGVMFNVGLALYWPGIAGPAVRLIKPVWDLASGVLLVAIGLRWIVWARGELNRDLRETLAEPTRPGGLLAAAALAGFFGFGRRFRPETERAGADRRLPSRVP